MTPCRVIGLSSCAHIAVWIVGCHCIPLCGLWVATMPLCGLWVAAAYRAIRTCQLGAVPPFPYGTGAGYIFSRALLQWVATDARDRRSNSGPEHVAREPAIEHVDAALLTSRVRTSAPTFLVWHV
jgi:hypothetical protein